MKNAEHIVRKAEDVRERANEVIGHIEKDLNDVDGVREEIRGHFDKLNTLQCTLQYMRVIQHIEYLRYLYRLLIRISLIYSLRFQ